MTGRRRDHPAVRAWNTLRSARAVPDGIAVLKETQKSQVYRLAGLGPGGSAVVAKQCARETAATERTVYEDILPHLPISALRYYGCIDEPDGRLSWLFVEDAGEERYSPADAVHRKHVARWLGCMHKLAPFVAAIARLPDRGPAFYLAQLRVASDTMGKLVNPVLTGADLEVLAALGSLCRHLESRWPEVETLCDGMPPSLMHGDFIANNVGIRSRRDGLLVLPFDWEQAGRGVAAADLGQRLPRGFPNPDLTTYWSVVREAWPHLKIADIQRLAETGKILRLLASINWAVACLEDKEVDKPMAKLRVYRVEMASAMKAVGLLEAVQ